MGIKLKKMKIFSQSTACAFVAVANGLSFRPGADPDRVWEITQSWLCNQNPESILCPPANPRPNWPDNFVRKEIQLYGGWDLPVPGLNSSPNSVSLSRPTRGCSMSHLPKRGETGSMKAVDCSAKEIQQFKEGNGPTGFTGFFSDEDYFGYRPEECYLVKDGKFIRLTQNCQSAVENNDVNRSVFEEIGEGDYKMPGHIYYY